MSEIPTVADEAVLVDFTASWCGPCKALAPVLEQISQELDGRLQIIKVDIDDTPAISERYGIKGVPTLLLFDQGELMARVVGAQPKQQLLDTITPLLA
jgi:thioredoxin 1